MNLNPEEISSIIKAEILKYSDKTVMTEVGTVVLVGDGIAKAHGLGSCMANELLQFEGGELGMAQNLEEDSVSIAILSNDSTIKEGTVVRRTGKVVSVPVGEGMLGRVVDALGKAMGKALDKAIVYGTGTKMPLGIITRIAQTSQPAGYPSTARTWIDLHTSNVKTGTGATGTNLFKEIITNSACADDKDYATQPMFWLMNKKTKNALLANAVEVNAAGALVAGLENQMPVVGGEIVELSFIPDNNIVFGYGDCYVLAERAGFRLENSEHAMFVNDKTVFKGTARYDGAPSIAEAFGVLTITNTAPTTSGITFASDTANP